MPSNITFREATFGDIPGIAEVHAKSWQAAYRGVVPDVYLDGIAVEKTQARWEAAFPTEVENGFRRFVAERDGKVVGFAGAGPARGEDAPCAGELCTLYVHPDYYRQGVGSELLRMCADFLRQRGENRMFLWAFADYKQGHDFYTKMHGQHVPERQGTISIGGEPLAKALYLWPDLKVLACD